MNFGNVLALFFGFQLVLVTCMTTKQKYEWFQSDPKGMYGSKIKIHDLRKLQFRDKLKKVVKSTGVRRSYKKFMKTILNLLSRILIATIAPLSQPPARRWLWATWKLSIQRKDFFTATIALTDAIGSTTWGFTRKLNTGV